MIDFKLMELLNDKNKFSLEKISWRKSNSLKGNSCFRLLHHFIIIVPKRRHFTPY